MRVVVVVVAALITLGLAAFGVVAAQKTGDPASIISLATQYISSAQNTVAPPAPAPVSAKPRVAANPVIQVADASNAPVAMPTKPAAEPVAAASTPAAAETPAAAAQTAPTPAPVVLAQNTAASTPAPAPQPAPSQAAAGNSGGGAVKGIAPCDKPGAIGLSRIVEIDTTGGPAFGTEHFKQYDFLRDKEVVLTFDDGPWPDNTPKVLKALNDNCAKATFFEIGEHATWRPDLTKELVQAGMTVGSHTWSHKDLAKNPYASDIEKAKEEIEMGVSAVHMAAEAPIAPFFRFPDLQQPADLMTYLGTRNIAIFSTDIDTFDFKIRKPEEVVKSVMNHLAKNGKGILLMHDFQHATADAMPEVLKQLKAGGYKIVHMVPKEPVTTLAKYDDMVRAQDKYSNANNTRPQSNVVKTINE